MGDIAILGIDGRFPGAADPAAYWDLLVRGGDAISEVPEARWKCERPEYGGFLADADAFDHEFFGISLRAAEEKDPQQRLMLQSADTSGLPVYAVIKGGAVNHNGRSNGLAAPNRRAQRNVITEAYRRSGIRPADAVAIEAHGTGTVLGDMIEIGPKPVLSSIVHRQARDIPVLPMCLGPQSTGTELLSAIARLYCDNLRPDWDALYDDDQRVPHRLRPYRFYTANRFWSKPAGTARVEVTSVRAAEQSTRIDQADDVASGVLAILADMCGYQAHEISQDADLYQDLGFDSIMLVGLKQRLETQWDHEIGIRELSPSLTRARDLLGFVRTRVTSPSIGRDG